MNQAHIAQLNSECVIHTSSAHILRNYIGDLSFDDYYRIAQELFPFLLPLIDPARTQEPAFDDLIASMNAASWEFEDQGSGGRGTAYNVAQRNIDNRKAGILSLLRCFSPSGADMPGPDQLILDVLGGDGTITRCVRSEDARAPQIISADLSSFMVKACLAQKFPCLRQSATQSLLRDSVLDGVLIAYGSHHLVGGSRSAAIEEAFRTLKHGGRLVLHDFEIGSAAAKWFDDVVDPFSRTGHQYPHYSRGEMTTLFEAAGFEDVRVFSMPDPFVLRGNSSDEARTNALLHLYRMYDLIRLPGDSEPDKLRHLEMAVNKMLGDIDVQSSASGYQATIRREALVAVGTKIT
jgi:SAM-dependent methyltransferase